MRFVDPEIQARFPKKSVRSRRTPGVGTMSRSCERHSCRSAVARARCDFVMRRGDRFVVFVDRLVDDAEPGHLAPRSCRETTAWFR